MPLGITPQSPPPTGGPPRLLGRLASRGWKAKLYAPESDVAGLRPEDLAAPERAFRAAFALPDPTVLGFALLRRAPEAGGLVLAAHWWDGAVLRRDALPLGGDGSPPRRSPDEAIGRVGSVDELVLMAREAAAWRRFVLDAARPSPDAYLAECCT